MSPPLPQSKRQQYVPELTWILFLRILDEREKHEAEDDTHVFTLSQVDEGLLLKMGEKVIDIFGNDTMTLMPVTAG